MTDSRLEVTSDVANRPVTLTHEEIEALGGEEALPSLFESYTRSYQLRCAAGDNCDLGVIAETTEEDYALHASCSGCPQAGAHQHVVSAIARDARHRLRTNERAGDIETELAPRSLVHEITDKTGQRVHVVDLDGLVSLMPAMGAGAINRLLGSLCAQSFFPDKCPYSNAAVQNTELWRQLGSQGTRFIIVENAAKMLVDEAYLRSIHGVSSAGVTLLHYLYERLQAEGYIPTEE